MYSSLTQDNNGNWKCKWFGHKFDNHKHESRPCNKWDDCDIKSHRIVVEVSICSRCGIKGEKQVL